MPWFLYSYLFYGQGKGVEYKAHGRTVYQVGTLLEQGCGVPGTGMWRRKAANF
jgi:hypothetical protein